MLAKKLCLSIFASLLLMLVCSSTAFAATPWDFTENWDSGWTNNTYIGSSASHSPWSSSSPNDKYISGGYGAHISNYSGRSQGTYSVHLGPTSSYSSSMIYDHYLRYTFSTVTPSSGKLTFWYYHYYSGVLSVRTSPDGTTWAKTQIVSSNTYVYGENTKVTIPSGTKYIEWMNTSGRAYSSYNTWIDTISYTLLPPKTAWDFSQNWDSGWSLDHYVGSSSNDSPWSSSSPDDIYISGTYGAHIDNYGGRYHGKYCLHLGNHASGSYSMAYDHYLRYTFSTATPAAGKLDFWYYHYYSGVFSVRTSANGTTWATQQVCPAYNYVYGASVSLTIPSGTKYIEWMSINGRSYYSYNTYIDDISFSIPPAWTNKITGYNENGANIGVINLETTTGSLTGTTVSKVIWEYKKSSATKWTSLPDDVTSSDGWTTVIDSVALGIQDFAFQVRAAGAYNKYFTTEWSVATFNVQNVVVGDVTVDKPISGVSRISIEAAPPKMDVLYPFNSWKFEGATSYYTYINLLDSSDPIPFGGNATKLTTQFGRTFSSSNYFRFKLWKSNGGNSYTEVASTSNIINAAGTQVYALMGSNWQNLPADLHIGGYFFRGCVYGNSSPPYSGNGNHTYLYNSSSSIISGTYSNWYTGSTGSRCAIPFRVLMANASGSPIESAVVRYRVGEEGESVELGEMTKSGGSYFYDWASWAIDEEGVYLEFRFNNGSDSDWYVYGPYTVYNRVDLTFQTNVNDVVPGPGSITINGELCDSPTTKQYLYYQDVEFEAPQYVFDENDKRWRWNSWSDDGNRAHSIETLPNLETLYTANYSRQYLYAVDSIRNNWTGTGPGWYDPGLDVELTMERYSVVTEGEERYECKGYTVPALELASNSLELLFTLTTDTTVFVLWERQFFFRSSNDYNTGSGNLPGWYAEGTTISFSVAQFFPNGDGARRRCAGYTMGEISEADVYSIVFDIYAYSPLVWTWNQQFVFEPFTNVGTIDPGKSWYDEGTEIEVAATPPASDDRIRYTFAEWKGIGAGAVNVVGGVPVCNPVIMSPIKQTAVFKVEYYLGVENTNGTLNPDSSGWYLPGTEVTINAVPPAIGAGSRYIVSWFSEDASGFNADADYETPVSIIITMDVPVIQGLTWHLQHKLTIENSSGIGFQSPEVGEYWYFDGERIHGYSQFVAGDKVCSGFASTGSLTSSDAPYYVGIITGSTTVHWAYRDRLDLPNFGVQAPIDFAVAGPLCFAYDAAGHPTAAYIAPGNNLVFATYNGTTWQQVVLATGVTEVDFISHAVGLNGAPFVALNDPASLNTMFVTRDTQNDAAPDIQPRYYSDSIEFDDDSAINPNVATDTLSGTSYISAYSAQGALILMTVQLDGETSVEVVDAIGVPGFANDIILDPISRLPIIVYNDAFDRSLKIARKLEGDGGWQIETIDDSGAVGANCVAVMGRSGDIYVAYRDYTRVDKSFVKLAVLDSNGWTITKIDSNGNVGRGLSMTLGGDDYPHLFYYGETFARLVRYMGASWQLYTVAGNITPVGDTAITIGIDSRPIMFYRDAGNAKIIYGITGNLAPDNSSTDSSGNWTPSSGGGGGGGCFIATAAFGDMATNAVSTLTNWRDSTLSASLFGSSLRDMYYSVSPCIASEQNASLNAILRSLLR